jgi:hypothetical protein
LTSIEQMFDTGRMRAGALEHNRDKDRKNEGEAEDPRASRLALVHTSVTTAATLAHERTIPVVQALADMVPSGQLQRGSNLAVHGVGATSFALALAGEAVRNGSFLAIIAPPTFGLGACIDFDVPLRRVVQFSLTEASSWAQVVAAVIEGFDIVMLADAQRVSAGQTRKLIARNRERGSVLLRVGGPAWPDAADLRFDVGEPAWTGLGAGHGHLQARQVAVQVAGRRHRGAPRTHQILLPASEGGVLLAPAAPVHPVGRVDQADRYAGSDIDDLLDVVDRDASAEDATSGDLGAIA